jgi:hypothetical protein
MAVLCEATRSQQVRSGAQQSFFTKKLPAPVQQEQKVHIKNNALILLEDIDIAFNDLGNSLEVRTYQSIVQFRI